MIFLTQGLPSPNTATRAIHGLAGIFFVSRINFFFLSFLTLLQQCVQERYLSEPMPMEGFPPSYHVDGFLLLSFWFSTVSGMSILVLNDRRLRYMCLRQAPGPFDPMAQLRLKKTH